MREGGCRWGCSRPARHSVLVEEGCYHQGRARFPHPAPLPKLKKKKSKTLPPTRAPAPASIRPRPACGRGRPTASVCGCNAELQVSAGRGCPEGARAGRRRSAKRRARQGLPGRSAFSPRSGAPRQLQEVRAAPAARRERGQAWGGTLRRGARAGEAGSAAARRRQWLPRAARSPASLGGGFMAAPLTAAVHRG